MNIGIVVHSQSGHTATLAKAIAEKFRQNNHEVDIMPLLTTGLAKPGSRHFTICNAPDQEELERFDAILFGGPVWGFKASPVIKEFLSWMKKIDTKKVASFVTYGLPWPSCGANQAIRSMNQELRASGGTVLPGVMLHYFFGFNKAALSAALDRIYQSIVR